MDMGRVSYQLRGNLSWPKKTAVMGFSGTFCPNEQGEAPSRDNQEIKICPISVQQMEQRRYQREQINLRFIQETLASLNLDIAPPSSAEEITDMHRAILAANKSNLGIGFGYKPIMVVTRYPDIESQALVMAVGLHDFEKINCPEKMRQEVLELLELYGLPEEEFDMLYSIKANSVNTQREHILNNIDYMIREIAQTKSQNIGKMMDVDPDEISDLHDKLLDVFKQVFEEAVKLTDGLSRDERLSFRVWSNEFHAQLQAFLQSLN